jgi:hypothetical protein
MAVEDHPLYPRWRDSLERVIETKNKRDACKRGTPDWSASDAEYQAALAEYDAIAREI